MKTMKIKLLSITAIFILLISCEGGTTFTKTIDNRSSEDVIIELTTTFGGNDPVTVKAKESKQIYWNDQMGNFVDDSYNCTTLIDTVEVTISNNKSLVKDIMNPDNWSRESKDGRNSREDCIFVITDNDIQ